MNQPQIAKPVTKLTKIIPRKDGSEVRIVAQAYFGAGLHCSIGVNVFRRQSSSDNWKLCSDRPHPNWREMSVEEYVRRGRSESLQVASPGEILAVVSAIGKPMEAIA